MCPRSVPLPLEGLGEQQTEVLFPLSPSRAGARVALKLSVLISEPADSAVGAGGGTVVAAVQVCPRVNSFLGSCSARAVRNLTRRGYSSKAFDVRLEFLLCFGPAPAKPV